MPLKVRFLRKCHTEARSGRRIVKTKQWKSRRHRRCIERQSLFAISISNLYTKHLPLNSYQESVSYTSVALSAVGTSVILALPPSLRDSVCLSPHISEEPLVFTFSPNRHGYDAVNKKGRQCDLLADWAFNLFRRYD